MPWIQHPRSRVAHFLADARTLCERFSENPAKPFEEVAEGSPGPLCSVCRRLLVEREPAAEVFLWIYSRRAFCKGCEMLIEWWLTPNLRFMPIDPQNWTAPEPKEIRQLTGAQHQVMLERSHFNTCPDAELFSGRKAEVAGREDAALKRYDRRRGETGA